MLTMCRGGVGGKEGGAILSIADLGFPFETESPFLFAVYHFDCFPRGNDKLGPDTSLRGHNIGADFGHPSGWNMYHGDEGVPGFPKHPHRGFETITVTRQGWVDHTDSLGNGGRFGCGDVQWMTAGRGISHAEMFPLLDRERENILELFQIWINLPRRSKMVEASFKMLWAEQLPRAPAAEEADVALIAGELPGFQSPPSPPPNSYASDPSSDVLVLTVKLKAGSSWTVPKYGSTRPSAGLNRNVYLFAGSPATVDGKRFQPPKKIKLRPDADVVLAATGGHAEFLLLQGRDIGEPVVQHGPFVMSSKAEIRDAFEDYQRTGFGGWPWKSNALVHGRDCQRFARYADGTVEEHQRL